jgi:NSS family neurotransmitter:Na+ symporter
VIRGALGFWRSRTTFVLALAAAAVGLGSLWRFAWLMGTHGGGPFMLSYIACLFLLAVPLLIAELVLGIHGRDAPAQALRHVADRALLSRGWCWLGVAFTVTALLLLGCQVVVAGWAIAFAQLLQGTVFSDASARLVGQEFTRLLESPHQQILWQAGFMAAVGLVSAAGIRRGVGAVAWLVIPAMLTLLGVLVQFSLDHGDLAAARDFLFTVRPIDVDSDTFFAALGHAVLTLGIGLGVGITYGTYAPRRIPVARSVLAVAVIDTLVALLAALAIFPVVLANNVVPNSGPGLLFISLPYAFANLPQGEPFGVLAMVVLLVAIFGMAIALLEPAVASLRRSLRLPRLLAVAVAAGAAWALSAAVTLSLASDGWLAGNNLLALIDGLVADVLVPVLALVTSLLVGWAVDPGILREQLSRESALFFSLWRWLLRYIAPLALAVILLADLFP